jgi:sugar/nucleoside kinase (ribokinase family)
MKPKKIVISGTGCALADFVYNRISFHSPEFNKYLSKKSGDGGLNPGKLVFTEELEKFAGKSYPEIFKDIIGSRTHDAFNVGGPSLVSMIHASQLLEKEGYEVKFFGIAGNDETSARILKMIRRTPLNIKNYLVTSPHDSPFTDVLSDPDYENGHGERTFINNIGAAWDYTPEQLTRDFFDSHIVAFGGTALVPQIHDNLTLLLEKAKKNNCITLVNTVFDFRNEKKNPGKPWPLVSHNENFRLIDLLIMDREEALMISGCRTIGEASGFFAATGVSSFIITNGADALTAWSRGGLFEKTELMTMPVSRMVTDELKSNPGRKGDTTGCGDNFAGGILASIALQLRNKEKGHFDLVDAVSWGVASGGLCCFTVGGTYLENATGEKRKAVQLLQKEYLTQIGY